MAIKGRVLLVDPIPKESVRPLVEDSEIEVAIYQPKKEQRSLGEIASEFDALIVDSTEISRRTIGEATKKGKLKLISQIGSSVENIDIEAATDYKVMVMNSPSFEDNAMAEYSLGLLFALSRNLIYGTNLVKKGKWHKRHRVAGSELEGKVLGILGMRQDGRLLAEKAQALGMDVLMHDNTVTLAERREVAKELGAQYSSLDDLLEQSDYVSLHLPECDRTHHMLTKERFKQMKGSAYLINVGTPGAVEEKILYKALKDRVIKGAAVDVVESGIVRGRDRLLRLDNLIITPSFGPRTKEARRQQPREAVEQVYNAIKFDAYKNVINRI